MSLTDSYRWQFARICHKTQEHLNAEHLYDAPLLMLTDAGTIPATFQIDAKLIAKLRLWFVIVDRRVRKFI